MPTRSEDEANPASEAEGVRCDECGAMPCTCTELCDECGAQVAHCACVTVSEPAAVRLARENIGAHKHLREGWCPCDRCVTGRYIVETYEAAERTRATLSEVMADAAFYVEVATSKAEREHSTWKYGAALIATHAQLVETRQALTARNAQLDALRGPIGAACVEHVELNGHIETSEQVLDYLVNDTTESGGKAQDFAASLRIVIDQCDRQRRRANWYEVAYTSGKAKLIAVAVEQAEAALGSEREQLREAPLSHEVMLMHVAGLLEQGAMLTEEYVSALRSERQRAARLLWLLKRDRDQLRDELVGAVGLTAIYSEARTSAVRAARRRAARLLWPLKRDRDQLREELAAAAGLVNIHNEARAAAERELVRLKGEGRPDDLTAEVQRLTPIANAALERHTVECEHQHSLCRETVDMHDGRCAVAVAQTVLSQACDAELIARARRRTADGL